MKPSSVNGDGHHPVLFGTDVLASANLMDDSFCSKDDGEDFSNQSCISFHDASSTYSNWESADASNYEDASTGDERETETEDNDPDLGSSNTRQENENSASAESSSSQQPCSIGIAEKTFGEVKDFWAWGKANVFILGNVMGAVEEVTNHVVHNVAGTTLHEVDVNLIRPHLKHMDAHIVSPALGVVSKLIQDASHHLLQGIVGPFVEQFFSQRALIEYAVLYEDEKMKAPLSLASRLRLDIHQPYYQSSSESLTESYDTNDSSGEELQSYNSVVDEAPFFIGYHDYDDDLSACWDSPNVPPSSPEVHCYHSFRDATSPPLASVSY